MEEVEFQVVLLEVATENIPSRTDGGSILAAQLALGYMKIIRREGESYRHVISVQKVIGFLAMLIPVTVGFWSAQLRA